ncbi:phosphatidylinositol-specific phospholipase C [Streptomyces sp. TRM66268-LWL]|uniref:1-phosphatidylinositol phosphodiesterase n=1 Tax=Streptomyces polyasparticus TaxID=2767826 RepID=A0ABR7SUK1_9ACTN|nr:phosphatidylinositol-specific phospholipase C [Streptomyces polyasparticus]MBC9719181.1 phosphatidylinositol-specific phospholipase C [Streptomyces polyasparticus]
MSIDRRSVLRGAAAASAAGLLSYAGVAPARARTAATADWMAGQADTTPLTRLTIPGTHDSGARHGGLWVECQNWTFAQQLAAGVRFLDIRCRVTGGSYAIHHGAFFQNLMFGDVLAACREFLAAHPSETVLMRVKQEYSQVGDAEFRAVFDDYLDNRGWRPLFHIGGSWPSLGTARGKVVLMADNGGLPGGIRWGDSSLFAIQDDYNAEPFAKWPRIRDHFRRAASSPGPQYINFVSTAAGLPPDWNADRLNPQTRDFLNSSEAAGWTGLGIVPMDFPEAVSGLLAAVLAHNP